MATTYPIQLSQLESLYLSDAMSMFTQGPPDALPDQASPYPTLLLKIGSAILESEQHKAPATVYLSLGDLWTMREVAKSSVVVGGERVGLNLLLKIYAGIRALTAEFDMHSLVSNFGETAHDEAGKSEYSAQLAKIKDGKDFDVEDESDNEGEEDGTSHKSGSTNQNGADNGAAN